MASSQSSPRTPVVRPTLDDHALRTLRYARIRRRRRRAQRVLTRA